MLRTKGEEGKTDLVCLFQTLAPRTKPGTEQVLIFCLHCWMDEWVDGWVGGWIMDNLLGIESIFEKVLFKTKPAEQEQC